MIIVTRCPACLRLYRFWRVLTPKTSTSDLCGVWAFFQKSPPYKIGGCSRSFSFLVSGDVFCEVYLLGGRRLVWRGLVRDIPSDFKSYYHEIRFLILNSVP